MKPIVISMAASSLLAALALAQPRYTVTDLGSVGPAGQPITLTNNGLVVGAAGASGGADHAVFWYKGWKADFGKPGLGGANSMAFGINEAAHAVGAAETSTADPNGEDYCGFKALGLLLPGASCLPFLWQNGVMTPLATLGGRNGVANTINNRGQAAGAAENTTVDPACPAPQKMQSKPVVWQNGRVQELPTADGDPDGVALAINDNGQIAGASGTCASFNPQTYINVQPLHALLWQNGKPTDLGSLGGTGHGFGIFALGLNNQGQVVGTSDLPGDAAFHAFLWSQSKGMQDLGTLAGDVSSSAIGINDAGVVVGTSLDASSNLRAMVWQNGTMTDLNTLIPADATLSLMLACSINAHGQIIGLAMQKGTTDLHGYLLTPSNGDNCGASTSAASQDAVPDEVQKLVRQPPASGRFGPRK